ncbi:MAG: fibronectin type III domain-containing protein [Steroidobacteraceae bacterium]
MRNSVFAARSHICGVVLWTLVTFGLSACGSDAGSSGSAAAVADTGSLVSPSVGLIDRSAGDTTQGTAPAASTTTPSSSTTVAVIDKGTPAPAPFIPPPKPISTGSATLDWTPPTENSDGSALTNLAGYTVYYGTSPDKLTESVKVSNPGLTAYTLTNLPPGTWYFAVTSYSAAGVESVRSGVISATI